jgi:NADH-quinone oxidoreductase subunit N
MNFNLYYVSPELILAVGGILALIIGLATGKFTRYGENYRVGILSPEVVSSLVLIAALVPSIALLTNSRVVKGISQFGGMIVVDGFALFFKIIAILSTLIVILLSIPYFRGLRFYRGEYYALLVFATLAITCLASSTDLVMIYLSLEFLSIVSYILVGYLKQDPRSNEAAMKYFLYGSVAAAVMVYGMSIMYGMTGTTSLSDLPQTLWSARYSIRFLAVALILVGFGYKISMVPFHQWTPDTYEGAPTPITAFLSVGSKAAGIAVLTRTLTTGIPVGAFDWKPFILLLSALTMTIGNLVAIPQVNIKRMLAYSSIAHAGYMLLGIAAIAYGSSLAVPSVLLYLFTYLFMNLGAFGVVTILSTKLRSDEIRDYAGLIKRAPIPAVALVLFLLSLAGIPPGVFIGKLYLFAAALQVARDTSNALFWLTVIAAANTVVSLYYYMNVARVMFFCEARSTTPVIASRSLNFVVALTAAVTVLLLVYPQPFIQLAHWSAALLSGI